MLGHCGKKADAAAVRALLDDPVKSKSSGADGLLAAYILLDPAAGWEFLYGQLKDPAQEFSTHYAGLRTLRFFYEFRPDVLKPEQLLAGLKALVAQKELADLPMEDLRKWGRWDQTDSCSGSPRWSRTPRCRSSSGPSSNSHWPPRPTTPPPRRMWSRCGRKTRSG